MRAHKSIQIVQRIVMAVALAWPASLGAAPPSPRGLRMTEWARDPQLQDPVALAFDRFGRLYVVETARRSSVDIDIRAHREWLLEDLANQTIDDTREFFRRQMSPERSSQNQTWLEDRNHDGLHDWRDLTTVSERIRLLEDTDQDGKADRSEIFAEGFQEEYTGVAAGVLPVGSDVLFTVYPDLWRLQDADKDGKAEYRSIVFHGFGVHAAFDGHDLHGLTVGPEGKIYFSCGDNGFSVTTREGKRLHHPNTGGVLRMNPDGSELEVFATGLRNVQEFDFDQYGNMFGVDNDGDLADERERAVYIAEGSDSGWRLNWQFRAEGWKQFNGEMTYNPWIAEGMWKPAHRGQPAYITPPMQNYSVGPGGFKFNPGTALNPDYRNFFFCIQFPVKAITAFRVQPQGAGFQMADEHLFLGGLMASSVNFSPDGALYIADWVGKWAPNGRGVIYRMDDPAIDGSEIRRQVQQLLANGLQAASLEELEQYLGHADRRIRQLAQAELVRRQMTDRLLEIARNATAPQLARIHALWGLIQSGQSGNERTLADRLPWTDPDAQIRQQCARVAGDLRLPGAEGPLVQLLADAEPLVQSFAAMALGKAGGNAAAQPLFGLLRRNADRDPFLRHAAVMGLSGCAKISSLAEARTDASASVRMGAVLALRRKRAEEVAVFLDDPATAVQREAVRAIHDDFSIPVALPAIASLLEQEKLPSDEPIMRRILSANLRVGTPEAAARLIQFLEDPNLRSRGTWETPLIEQLQIEALNCLAVWGQAPLVDRVEGRIRKSTERDKSLGERLLASDFEQVTKNASPTLMSAATKIAMELSLPLSPALLDNWIRSADQPLVARKFALQMLATNDSEQVGDAINYAWSTDHFELRATSLEVLAGRDKEAAFERITESWSSASVPLRQRFIAILAILSTPEADERLSQLLDEQINLHGQPELSLDVLRALEARDAEGHRDRLQLWMEQMASLPWGQYRQALTGGDAVRGEALYRGHVGGQCVRCHEAGGAGKQAGPELRGIGSKVSREYLLEALVDPSARIAQGFETVLLILDDGRSVSGTVLSENEEAVTVGTAQAETIEVAKQSIDERVASKVSAMPQIIETLTPLEVRDLVAYLETLR